MKLTEIRKAKGMSQGKLAKASGVTTRAIQNYEQKTRDINQAQAITLYKLVQALDCNMEDLLELDEPESQTLNLRQYYGKDVILVTYDDVTFRGHVSDYFAPDENESNKESIVVDTEDERIVEFYEDKIKTIEIDKAKKD